jgi:hypothetical protein
MCHAQSVPLSGCPTGTSSYWTFDDADNPGRDDVDGHSGTVRGAEWVPTGQVGGALLFDGVDDVYVGDVRPIASSGSGGVTYAFWGRLGHPELAAHGVWTVKGYGWQDKQGDVVCDLFNTGGHLVVGSVIYGHGWEPVFIWDTPVDGDPAAFHHVACTYDSDKLRKYFDGRLVATADVTNGITDAANSNPLVFGTWFATPYGSDGYLDEVAVFNRALAPEEIAAMYAKGLSGTGYCSGSGVLAALTLTQPLTAGCLKTSGKVKLVAPAPAGGLTVALHSDNPNVIVPASLTFKEGVLAKSFSILTRPVAERQSATIQAVVPSQVLSAVQTIKPIGPKSVTLSPNPVVGGNPVAASVMLQCPAAPGDIVVEVSSSNSSVAAPTVASITVPAGTRTMLVDVTTATVDRVRKPSIIAVANGVKRQKTLTVNPIP